MDCQPLRRRVSWLLLVAWTKSDSPATPAKQPTPAKHDTRPYSDTPAKQPTPANPHHTPYPTPSMPHILTLQLPIAPRRRQSKHHMSNDRVPPPRVNNPREG